MKSVDLVADSYFKEKKNDFIKKVQAYLDSCKAPRKCTPSLSLDFYLIEKFPKIFDYFELLLARAKGIFNNEINKLSATGRNQQAEIESLNRVIKYQEELLA